MHDEAVVAQRMLFTDRRHGRRPLPVIGERADIRYYGREAKSVLNNPESTGMGFWSINPYIGCAFGCTYCYARFTHRYATERELSALDPDTGRELRAELTELPAWLAFERRIFVKRNAADVLRGALRPGSARLAALTGGDTLVIGTATDPYQPAERSFRVTRSLLEVVAAHRNLRLVIITKSALVARDVDLLARIARRSRITVHLSLITLDRELARRLEPRAPTPESRLRAVSRLADAGVDVGINVMPVLPGITDQPAALSALVRRVADAGASHVNAGALRLQAAARNRFLPFIREAYPELVSRYEATYAGHTSAGERYRAGLKAFFQRECRRAGIRCGRSDDESETSAHVDAPRQMEFTLDSRRVE
jgi:DNA repair photolyase